MKKVIISIYCIMVLFAVKSQYKKEGVVSTNLEYFSPKRQVYYPFMPCAKEIIVYYKDSLVIEKVERIVNKSLDSKDTCYNEVLYYLFIDLRTRSFYEYKALSADSMFIKKYTKPDSTQFSGWNFYSNSFKTMSNDNVEFLRDTVMSGILYKRVKSSAIKKNDKGEDQEWQYVAYVRCDLKGSIFHLARAFEEDNKLGCPIVRVETMVPSLNFKKKNEVTYFDRELSNEELAIFNAWEKNAKEHPVISK